MKENTRKIKKEKKSPRKNKSEKKLKKSSKQKSLKTQIIVALIIGLIISACGVVLASSLGSRTALNKYFYDEVYSKKEAFLTALNQRGEKLASSLNLLKADENFLNIVDNAYFDYDYNSITSYCSYLNDTVGSTNVFILDNTGKILFSSQKLIPNPRMLIDNNITSKMKPNSTEYILSLHEEKLCYVAITKIVTPDGFSGYCALEDNLILDEVSDLFAQMLNCEITIYKDNIRIGTSFLNPDNTGSR